MAVQTVQKFHPNGRYGRRSVDNFAEPHAEFGKLGECGGGTEANVLVALVKLTHH